MRKGRECCRKEGLNLKTSMEMVLWGSFEENMVGGVGHEDPMSFINMELPKDKDVSIYGFWSVSEVKLGSFLAPCRSATLFCISFLNVHL